MRLNKFLAHHAGISRRAADELIALGKVKVNNQLAKVGQQIEEQDQVTLHGKPVTAEEQLEYYAVYKPKGFVSTAKDLTGRPIVTALVKSNFRLYPVGRLDLMSEGLIILTNDGEATYKLTHPKFAVEKEYLLEVTGNITANVLAKFTQGIRSEHQTLKAKAIKVIKQDSPTQLQVILSEGKHQHIRRICKALNLEVVSLKRVRIGKLELGELKPGEARLISLQDIV